MLWVHLQGSQTSPDASTGSIVTVHVAADGVKRADAGADAGGDVGGVDVDADGDASVGDVGVDVDVDAGDGDGQLERGG